MPSASADRNGSSNSKTRSRWLIAVDSPPGITSPSTESSSVRGGRCTAAAPAAHAMPPGARGVALQRQYADAFHGR